MNRTDNFKAFKNILDRYFPNAVCGVYTDHREEYKIPGCRWVSIYNDANATIGGLDDDIRYWLGLTDGNFNCCNVNIATFERILNCIANDFKKTDIKKPMYKVYYTGIGGSWSELLYSKDELVEWINSGRNFDTVETL